MYITSWVDYEVNGHTTYTVEKIMKGENAGKFLLGTCNRTSGESHDYLIVGGNPRTVDELKDGLKNGAFDLREITVGRIGKEN